MLKRSENVEKRSENVVSDAEKRVGFLDIFIGNGSHSCWFSFLKRRTRKWYNGKVTPVPRQEKAQPSVQLAILIRNKAK